MSVSLFGRLSQITCRILANDGRGGRQVGTGFFYSFDNGGQPAMILVTNRHVLEGMADAQLVFSQADEGGRARPNAHEILRVLNLPSIVTYHPDPRIDLACFGVGEVFSIFAQKGLKHLITALEEKNIPSGDANLSAVEEILMVGYPTGLFDSTHNRPIIRRGITASDYNLDYCGRPEFLIDAACFPGSSGSPVVIANEGAYSQGEILTVGTRFYFLGVLWGGPQFSASGAIEPVPIPTAIGAIARMSIPMNLGFCIKAREINALVQAAIAGQKPTAA
ncbi:MAG TPA: serine protease [Bosea sp. (in: a-proteobacteria)]